MAYATERSQARSHDSGWPTTPHEALWDSAAAAKTTIPDDTLVLFGFDFSDLPTNIAVRGIGLRLEGLKDHAGGSGNLRFGLELSWDSGTTWTALKQSALLQLTTATFIVGGPDDLWGHSWTRAELVTAGAFRIRVTADYDNVVTTPTWHLVWITASAFYEETLAATFDSAESVYLSELVKSSIDALLVRERIGVFDSGSRSGTALADRPLQHLKLGGTAVTLLETDSDFTPTAARPARREAIGVMLQIDITGPTLFIGDAVLSTKQPSGLFPADRMQPGLLSVGEITQEADFLAGPTIPSIEVTFANREYVDQSDASDLVPKTISKHSIGKSVVGRAIKAWVFADSGDGWKKRVVFNGQVEEIEMREHEVIVRGVQIGTTGKVIPDIIVDENLFDYEPGSAGVDTGEQIQGNLGKVVPVGIGRFDYGAVKKPTALPAGHPFRYTTELGPEDSRHYTFNALFPAMLGLKHPMMPTIHVAKNYRRTSDDTVPRSFPYQNVFLYGSRKSVPHLSVGTGPPDSQLSQVFPGAEGSFELISKSTFHLTDYVLAFTWLETSGLSVGMPAIAPNSQRWFSDILAEQDALENFIFDHCSIRPMERLSQPGRPFAHDWSDETAVDAYGLFSNWRTPRLKVLHPGLDRWPGVLQTLAIPMPGVTLHEEIVGPADPELFATPPFRTTDGVGQGYVENSRNVLDDDFENYTRIQNIGYLSLRCPIDAPPQGKIKGVRVCLLWNPSTSTAQNVYMLTRFGPFTNYGIKPQSATNGVEFNKDFGAVHDETQMLGGRIVNVPAFRLSSVSGPPFASIWFLPFFDTQNLRPYEQFSTSNPNHLKRGRTEWRFTSLDWTARVAPTELVEWPWDFMLHVRDESLGVPIASRWFDVVAIWFEVVFESRLNQSVDPFVVNIPFRARDVKFGYPEGGVWRSGRPAAPGGFWRIGGEQNATVSFDQPAREQTLSPLYVTGKGPVDDVGGGITGTAGKIVENPADAASLLIRHYLGDTVFADRATGAAYGSLATARTLLGTDTYRMAIVLDEADSIGNVMKRIGAESRAIIMERIDDSGDLQWVALVDTPDPETQDVARLYRGLNGFLFRWDDLVVSTFSARQSPIEDLFSSVRLRYGFHLPTRSWSNEKFVTPDASNFTTGAATYIAAMDTTRRDYAVQRALTVDAADVWDPAVAETLCKWYADRVRRRYVIVEFETFLNAADLQPGQVIKFNDEIQDRVSFPGQGLGAWSVHQFNVIQTSLRQDAGQLARIFVRAQETYSVAS